MAGRTRRAFLRDGLALGGLGLLVACAPAVSPSAPPARTYRIAWQSADRPDAGSESDQGPYAQTEAPLQERLAELGYVEGRNLTIDRVTAAEMPQVLQNGPELIIVASGRGVVPAMKAAPQTPIVLSGRISTDSILGQGLVQSLAHPGGKVTGVVIGSAEIDLKRLQLLVEALPGVQRVAGIGLTGGQSFWESAASGLGIHLFQMSMRAGAEAAVSRAVDQGAEALMFGPAGGDFRHTAELARDYKLPASADGEGGVTAGALMTYTLRVRDQQRRAAEYVDRILQGADPADLPIEQASRFDLIVNTRTMRELGISLPRDFAAQVDEWIE